MVASLAGTYHPDDLETRSVRECDVDQGDVGPHASQGCHSFCCCFDNGHLVPVIPQVLGEKHRCLLIVLYHEQACTHALNSFRLDSLAGVLSNAPRAVPQDEASTAH